MKLTAKGIIKKVKGLFKHNIHIFVIVTPDKPKSLRYCIVCQKYKSEYHFTKTGHVCYECKKTDINIDITKIISIVCEWEGIEVSNFKKEYKLRKREYVTIRQRCHYFANKFTDLSYTDIGRYIQNKDHASVMYSIKTVENLIETDKKYAREMEILEKKIAYKFNDKD